VRPTLTARGPPRDAVHLKHRVCSGPMLLNKSLVIIGES
jgi:hypothetical protein